MLHLACDVHTHTLYSRHAYSTIEENVRAAAEARLELLGSADHFSPMIHGGPVREGGRLGYPERDYQYFGNCGSWPRTWHGVRVLHGCEADIVDLEGRFFGSDAPILFWRARHDMPDDLTLKERVFSQCDYVVASVHDRSFSEGASLAATTRMYVRALEDPKVLVLGHAGRAGVPFDVDEVLAAAKDLHKLVEINEHSFEIEGDHIPVCRHLAERCAEMGVMIAVDSDAHVSASIGQLGRSRALLEEIHFPQRLVATRDAATFLAALEAGVGTTVK